MDLGVQEVGGADAAARGTGGSQDALRLLRVQVLGHVVEVEGEDLLVLRALGVDVVDGLAQLVEGEGKEPGHRRVEPGGVDADAGDVEVGRLVGEGRRRLLRVRHQAETLVGPAALHLVQPVGGDVNGRVQRQLEHLDVAGAGELPHQDAGEEGQEEGEGQDEERSRTGFHAGRGEWRCA